jgi:uncharacterized protein (DUF1786 family)
MREMPAVAGRGKSTGEVMRTTALAWVCISLGLTGCASMSKNECLTVDWRTVGYEDGVAGRSGDMIGRYRKACADHGVAPNLNAYQTGRAEGLREYCQPQNGFRVGASGADYSGTCPADMAPAFTKAYESGRELHAREYRVDSAVARLASMRRELEGLEQQLTRLGFVVVSRDTTSEERVQALLETRQVMERHERLEREIAQLEQDKQRFERDLEDYRMQVAYAG